MYSDFDFKDRFETFRLIWKRTEFAFEHAFSMWVFHLRPLSTVELCPSDLFYSSLVVFEVRRITLSVETPMCTNFLIEI